MKKFFQIAAVTIGLFFAQGAYADDNSCKDNSCNKEDTAAQCCPEEHPCEQPTNDCWCKYVRYKPCYYTEKRCVEEKVPCKKRCCRMVPKYYEVKKCKMVPQYYTETVCKQEPEYYDVEETKCTKKWVCEQKCKYVPEYFWKHVCGQQGCPSACPKDAPKPQS